MKACAWCAEDIQDAALICRYCGRDQRTGTTTASATPTAAPADYTVGSMSSTNTNAVIALVCALFVPFIGGIVGLVLGSRARTEIAESGGRQSGDGVAIAAMILGGLQVLFFVIVMFGFCAAVSNSGY